MIIEVNEKIFESKPETECCSGCSFHAKEDNLCNLIVKDLTEEPDTLSYCITNEIIWTEVKKPKMTTKPYTILDFKQDQDKFNNISGQSSKVTLADLDSQLTLIKEEVLELDVEIQEGDECCNEEYILAETIDVLYTTLGLLQKLENKGINVNKAMEIIAKANLSKFPTCPTDLKDSINHYKEKGVEVISSYNEDYDLFVIKDNNEKVRKPLSFVKADISSCVNKGTV